MSRGMICTVPKYPASCQQLHCPAQREHPFCSVHHLFFSFQFTCNRHSMLEYYSALFIWHLWWQSVIKNLPYPRKQWPWPLLLTYGSGISLALENPSASNVRTVVWCQDHSSVSSAVTNHSKKLSLDCLKFLSVKLEVFTRFCFSKRSIQIFNHPPGQLFLNSPDAHEL